MLISKYKAILFDWDGTLVDTCDLVLDAHNHVRTHYNQPTWTMGDFLGRASQSAREYYPTIYGDKADEAQVILYQYVEDHHLSHLKTMEGSLELLEFIKSTDTPMGIVSNKRHKFLNIEIDYMQWQDYFEVAIGAGAAARDKPSVDPLLMVLEKMGGDLTPSDILYIGDTETDLILAQKAECDIALIQSDKPRPDLVEKYSPNYACNDIADFINQMK